MIEPNVGIITPYWIPFQYDSLKSASEVSVSHQGVSSGRLGLKYFDMFEPSELVHVGCVVAHVFVVPKIGGRAHRTRQICVFLPLDTRCTPMTQTEIVANFMHLICHGTERFLSEED